MLGLGDIGALAGKPVMEGKGCLFKKFAGIHVFDVEIGETDPDKIIEVVGGADFRRHQPGGRQGARVLLHRTQAQGDDEDTGVFHDDQHGTAIVTAAAVLNGLKIVGKSISEVKLTCSGAGAAALACLDLLVSRGLKMDNVLVADGKGVLYKGRAQMDASKARYPGRVRRARWAISWLMPTSSWGYRQGAW